MTRQRPTSSGRPPRRHRVLRVVGIVVACLIVLTGTSAVANIAVTWVEQANLAPYGQRVSLAAGDINVYRTGGPGPAMVLLSGYGTSAPAIDFAPLIREVNGFDVIVIEGYGYGYSALDVPNRTVENITTEIHEVLGRLGVLEPVILVGHSVGGIYARYYANAYPGEVSAIIGIDPTPATPSSLDAGTPSRVDAVLAGLGLIRWGTTMVPGLIQPPGTAYTPDERRRIAAMTNWNYGHLSVADEWAHIGANSSKVSARPLPSAIPVLEFVSSESIKTIPGWLERHQAELANVSTHQLQIVEGAHYLHWTQSPELGRAMSEFIAAHVPAGPTKR